MMNFSKYAKFFDTLYTDDVYLFEPGEPLNDHGDIIPTWNRHDLIKGSVQDYSGDLAYQEYGMRVNCEKRIFVPLGTAGKAGWGFSSSATKEPELEVKWAPNNKTHIMILAGTR